MKIIIAYYPNSIENTTFIASALDDGINGFIGAFSFTGTCIVEGAERYKKYIPTIQDLIQDYLDQEDGGEDPLSGLYEVETKPILKKIS